MCHIKIDVSCIKLAYWLIAASASVFYAIFAVDALEVSKDDKKKIAENGPLRWHQLLVKFSWLPGRLVPSIYCSPARVPDFRLPSSRLSSGVPGLYWHDGPPTVRGQACVEVEVPMAI